LHRLIHGGRGLGAYPFLRRIGVPVGIEKTAKRLIKRIGPGIARIPAWPYPFLREDAWDQLGEVRTRFCGVPSSASDRRGSGLRKAYLLLRTRWGIGGATSVPVSAQFPRREAAPLTAKAHVYVHPVKSERFQTSAGRKPFQCLRAYPFLRRRSDLAEEIAGGLPDGRTHFCASGTCPTGAIRVPVSAGNGAALIPRGCTRKTVPVSASRQKNRQTVPDSADATRARTADRPSVPAYPYLFLRAEILVGWAMAYPFLRLSAVRKGPAMPIRTRFCGRQSVLPVPVSAWWGPADGGAPNCSGARATKGRTW